MYKGMVRARPMRAGAETAIIPTIATSGGDLRPSIEPVHCWLPLGAAAAPTGQFPGAAGREWLGGVGGDDDPERRPPHDHRLARWFDLWLRQHRGRAGV